MGPARPPGTSSLGNPVLDPEDLQYSSYPKISEAFRQRRMQNLEDDRLILWKQNLSSNLKASRFWVSTNDSHMKGT